MRRSARRRSVWIFGLLAALVPCTASANSISLGLFGLDVAFGGGSMYDMSNSSRGSGAVGDATPLGSMSIVSNGDYVDYLEDGLYADFFIAGVPSLPGDTTVMSSGGSYFDLLTSEGKLLGLSLGSTNITYTTGQLPSITVDLLANGVLAQSLPGGLVIEPGDQVSLYISVPLTGTPPATLTSFVASGGYAQIDTMSVEAPEPSTLASLLSLATAALTCFLWKRR